MVFMGVVIFNVLGKVFNNCEGFTCHSRSGDTSASDTDVGLEF